MKDIETRRIINTVPDGTARKALQQLQDANQLLRSALSGDMVLEIAPATVDRVATSEAWSRYVSIALKNSAGMVHDWCNLAFTTTLSIADTSSAGTASIEGSLTTLTLVNGKATIQVNGDAADWLEDDTDTLTVADITINGMTVTGGTSVQTFIAAA